MFTLKMLVTTNAGLPNIAHSVNVRVVAAPYWDFDPPQDIEQSEESTAELECLASGQPAPIVKWSMNGKPLH
ncbi:hypothetical protein COOONC_23009, partial [Cooperia oncophora]